MVLAHAVGSGLYALLVAAAPVDAVKDVQVVNDATRPVPVAPQGVTPIQGSVNVANQPVVMVGNAPSVTVENTPSVNVANTPAVTVSNTPSVNVANMPTVQVDPAQLAAAIRSADRGRCAFQRMVSLQFPADSPAPQAGMPVPSGRIVIEQVAAWVGLTSGSTLSSMDIYTNVRDPGAVDSTLGYHYLLATPTGPSSGGMAYDQFVVTQPVRIYVDGEASIVVHRGVGWGQGQLIATISGYIVDCVPDSSGP